MRKDDDDLYRGQLISKEYLDEQLAQKTYDSHKIDEKSLY